MHKVSNFSVIDFSSQTKTTEKNNKKNLCGANKLGWSLICTKGHFCAKDHYCTKTLLHSVNLARWTLLHKVSLLLKDN